MSPLSCGHNPVLNLFLNPDQSESPVLHSRRLGDLLYIVLAVNDVVLCLLFRREKDGDHSPVDLVHCIWQLQGACLSSLHAHSTFNHITL